MRSAAVSTALLVSAILCLSRVPLAAAELYVGRSSVSITPKEPVPLSGQMRTRISQRVESECLAVALALETRGEQAAPEQVVFVACDLVAIREGLTDEVRAAVKPKVPDLDVAKLILSATHTHTAPEMIEGRYDLPDSGIMRPDSYRRFFIERVAAAVEKAWKSRKHGKVGWGLGYAAVAQNRIAVSIDGSAKMYGDTSQPSFARFEGYEDHGVEVLCFWDTSDKPIATAINVACPAQEVENRSAVNADFWHPVRKRLQARYGDEFAVLGWTGSAGDQSPHSMYRKAAEERMRRLRNVDRLDDIARRIVAGWDEAYEGAAAEKHADVQLRHQAAVLPLPVRQVTQEEALAAQSKADELEGQAGAMWIRNWNLRVVERFKLQRPHDTFAADVHVVRIGDVSVATNPFELYGEYGVRMKARGPALQTFVVQLAGPGSYLPSERGVLGGAYGAIVQSNQVGPEGGRIMVDETLKMMSELWRKTSQD